MKSTKLLFDIFCAQLPSSQQGAAKLTSTVENSEQNVTYFKAKNQEECTLQELHVQSNNHVISSNISINLIAFYGECHSLTGHSTLMFITESEYW